MADASIVPVIGAAVAPIVMVSAAGLLFIGVQTKNLHLADRVRELMREYRALASADRERREEIAAQLRLFDTRIRRSQHALEMLYVALVSFVTTAVTFAIKDVFGGAADGQLCVDIHEEWLQPAPLTPAGSS